MGSLFEQIQLLAKTYGATRLLAYATAFFTTITALIVSLLLYITRKEDK